MRLTTPTCGLAFLITTLIVAAVSLPQSSSLPESSSPPYSSFIPQSTNLPQSTTLPESAPGFNAAALSRGQKPPPPNWTPPTGCVGIGAHDIEQDEKRDLQRSETNNAALQPRTTNTPYACGKLITGWQTDTFQFFTTAPVKLAWNVAHGHVGNTRETVTLMKVNPSGPATAVGGETGLYNWQSSGFTPAIGTLYYVQLVALPHCLITWWIAPLD
ncbi:hypothetical protein MMC27_000548 [Xylographa pallens]|nr:hypothetical protein [Xylographa pallens]